MSADHHTRRSQGLWRAVRGVFAALGPTRAEQILMWEAWRQASRAAVPATGPPSWVLTLDGYTLAGDCLPASSGTRGGGTP